MLKITHLSKKFKEITALENVSLEVNPKEIFGFLGPNGAGKTTCINCICGLLKPDSGSILIDGEDISAGTRIRKKLGVVPQDVALYEEFNAVENLHFWGGLYGMRGRQLKSRTDFLLEMTGLAERAKDPVKKYSGGMKRRLNMAAGLIHNPKLILMDEPTVGIDPQARHQMLDTVKQIAGEGTTVLYTTHYLDEVETLCGRLAIIDHGRILTQGTQEEIKQIVGENRLLKVNGIFDKSAAEALTSRINGLSLISIQPDEAIFSLPVSEGTGAFLETMVKSGFKIENFTIKEPSLDSVFIKLTGRELRD